MIKRFTVVVELMTNSEVCKELNISKQLLSYYVKKGYIRRVPKNLQHLYLKDDVLKIKVGIKNV